MLGRASSRRGGVDCGAFRKEKRGKNYAKIWKENASGKKSQGKIALSAVVTFQNLTTWKPPYALYTYEVP